MDPSSFSSHEPYFKADHFKGGGSALHPFNGALLVFSHVTAIAYDVRAQDRGETASAGGYMG
jgi:hypothetical protein